MSFVDPYKSMQVCVRHCPSTDITSWQQARDFAIHNNSRLCRYDIDPKEYEDQNWSSRFGPCPKLPVLKRYNCYDIVTDHFSGAGRAISPMCVFVCLSVTRDNNFCTK